MRSAPIKAAGRKEERENDIRLRVSLELSKILATPTDQRSIEIRHKVVNRDSMHVQCGADLRHYLHTPHVNRSPSARMISYDTTPSLTVAARHCRSRHARRSNGSSQLLTGFHVLPETRFSGPEATLILQLLREIAYASPFHDMLAN